MRSILFFVLASLLYSCKTDCINPHIDSAKVISYSAPVDSFARIVRYKKGNNFSTIVDTINQLLNGPFVEYYFSASYDYRITLMPHNKQHSLKDISYGNEKITKTPGNNPGQCSSSASYTVDDSVFNLPYISYDGAGRDIVINLR